MLQKLINNEQLYGIGTNQLNSLLHRSICAITFLNTRRRMGMGSGVLISPNLVLTVAHNIYDLEYGGINCDFKLYFGADGSAEEYFEVESWRYIKKYEDSFDSKQGDPALRHLKKLEFDYAIIKLKKRVIHSKYLPLSASCEQCLMGHDKQTHLEIFGFPGVGYRQNYQPKDKYANQFKLHQYGLSKQNRIVKISPEMFMIGYGVSTLPGQSGAPVCADAKIIAIHVAGGNKNQEFNVGRLITPDLLNNLKKWRQQLKGDPFTIMDMKMCPHSLVPKKVTIIFDLENSASLTKLDLSDKKIKAVDVSEHIHLQHLSLSGNMLTEVDFSSNINLVVLELWKNQIKQIDVSKCINLTTLQIQNNKLVSIDLSQNINLYYLYMSNNQLKEIDLGNNNQLHTIELNQNRLTSVRVWPPDDLWKLELRHQESSDCEITLLFRQDYEYDETMGKGSQVIQQIGNRHHCKYSFKACKSS